MAESWYWLVLTRWKKITWSQLTTILIFGRLITCQQQPARRWLWKSRTICPDLVYQTRSCLTVDLNLCLITSRSLHSRSNGKVESYMKSAKKMLKKCKKCREDQYLALLHLRNRPTQGMDSSPAQRLMGRRTKTIIPTSESLPKPDSSHLVAPQNPLYNFECC